MTTPAKSAALALLGTMVGCGHPTPFAPPQCLSQSGDERATCLHVAAGRLRVHAAALSREGFRSEATRLVDLSVALDREVTEILLEKQP
jgi:hypothetical protein